MHPMFLAALLAIAKLCPSTNEWMKKITHTHTHTHTHTQAVKKNEIMPFAKTWLELAYHAKQNKSE